MFQHAPTNKLLYAKDIPQFKQEVKAYYNCVREQQPITTAEFKDFLLEESRVCFYSFFLQTPIFGVTPVPTLTTFLFKQKHDNEFNEPAALRELYKFIHQYFTEVRQFIQIMVCGCRRGHTPN